MGGIGAAESWISGGAAAMLEVPAAPRRIMLDMPGTLISRTTSLLLVLVFLTAQTWATCGGGGGGGMGGMGSGGGTQTYPVPWKVIHAEDMLKEGLALYWLPSSQQELEKSSLRFSQALSCHLPARS